MSPASLFLSNFSYIPLSSAPKERHMATQKERRAAPRKTVAARSEPQGSRSGPPAPQKKLSNEDLYRLVAETAYFKAKARNFEPGGEVQDWIEAEKEVRGRLGAS
jgi:hypothetical protein